MIFLFMVILQINIPSSVKFQIHMAPCTLLLEEYGEVDIQQSFSLWD